MAGSEGIPGWAILGVRASIRKPWCTRRPPPELLRQRLRWPAPRGRSTTGCLAGAQRRRTVVAGAAVTWNMGYP